MKTRYKNCFFLLAVLLCVPAYMWAQGENVKMNMSVTNEDWTNNAFTVQATAYVNGHAKTDSEYKNVDLYLLLDASDKMIDHIMVFSSTNDASCLNQLNTTLGAVEGYYTCRFDYHRGSTSLSDKEISDAPMRYYNSRWQAKFNRKAWPGDDTDWYDLTIAEKGEGKCGSFKAYRCEYMFTGAAKAIINAAKSYSITYGKNVDIKVISVGSSAEQKGSFSAVNSDAQVNAAKSAVESISYVTHGSKCNPDQGFNLIPSSDLPSTDVIRTVVFISGFSYRTHGKTTDVDGYVTISAGKSVITSKSLKEKGVKVFTVGVYENDYYSDFTTSPYEADWKFLQHLSSNYPNASAHQSGGSYSDDSYSLEIDKSGNDNSPYCVFIKNDNHQNPQSDKLNNFVATAGLYQVTSSVYDYDTSHSVLTVDFSSGNFKNFKVLTDQPVTVEVDKGTWNTSKSQLDWADGWTTPSAASLPNITPRVDGNTKITVSGFDYGKYHAPTSSVDSHPSGYRIRVTFKVMIDPECPGGLGIPICTSDASGLYLNSTAASPLASFTPPTLNLPNIEIVKTGLKKGESVLFEVRQQTNRNGSTTDLQFNSNPIMVWITGDADESQPDKAIVKFQQPTYTYTYYFTTRTADMNYQVKQLSWDWAYSTSSTTPTQSADNPGTVSQALGTGSAPKTFTFTSSPADGKPAHAEDHTSNQKKQ